MTLSEATRLIEEHRATCERAPCRHGHINCSTRDGGPCFDETITTFPELEDML
jgi:hypothetical protein